MSVTATASPAGENTTVGIAWMLMTIFWFVTLDAAAKVLLAHYPVVQVVWARFFFHLLAVALILGTSLRRHARSANPRLQLARSVLMGTTTSLFFLGLQSTTLAMASTIMFMSPILVTVLAIPMLGEQVGLRRWMGVLLGFAGALIVIRPGLDGFNVGSLFLFAAACSNALYQITTRQLRHQDGQMTTLFYTATVGTVVLTAVVPFEWVPPALPDFGLMVLLGLVGGIGHLCLIRAFQAAPASVVVPFSYTSLIWATLFGYSLFGELPDRWTLTGAALIVASGLHILYRERKLHRRTEKSATIR